MSGLPELLGASRPELARVMREGHPIAPEDLDDACYRGISLGLPRWVEAITWKTFMKAFSRDEDSGRLQGWNVKLEQDGLEAPPRPKRRRDGQPKAFGYFEVITPPEGSVARGLDRGLLIHYGRGANAALDPIRHLRDPVVALRPGDPSLLLGWSYLDLGFSCPTPSYFTLERVGRTSELAIG